MENPDVLRYLPIFGPLATLAGLPPALVAAVIHQESGGDPEAVSLAGARGLMQLMPATAAALGVTDAFNPEQNLRAGITYLAEQYAAFRRLDLAVAAYNAGPQAVQDAGPDVPPFAETYTYVKLVALRTLDYLDLDVQEIVAAGRAVDQAPLTHTWREAHANALGVADLLSDAIRQLDEDLTAIEHTIETILTKLPSVAPSA